MTEHDPVYRQALEAAKRDFTALEPEVERLRRILNALRNLIHAVSTLLEEPVDDEFEYPYNRTRHHGSSSLRERSTGRTPGETQHDKGR